MAQGENARHEISMSAGIMSNQAYDTRLTYQYYLNKSIGRGVLLSDIISNGTLIIFHSQNFIMRSGILGGYQKRIVNHRISI